MRSSSQQPPVGAQEASEGDFRTGNAQDLDAAIAVAAYHQRLDQDQ
jgi:hypothetical protein